jgi:hypothetical protein
MCHEHVLRPQWGQLSWSPSRSNRRTQRRLSRTESKTIPALSRLLARPTPPLAIARKHQVVAIERVASATEVLPRPTRRPGPALHLHVAHIVDVRAEKEMIGTNAQRVVAAMQDVHPLWNGRAICDLPSHAVRALAFTLPAVPSVSIVDAANPNPATARVLRAPHTTLETRRKGPYHCSSPRVQAATATS